MHKGNAQNKEVGELNKVKGPASNWLDAHNDPLANIRTLSQCMTFSDISADGDNKLVVADFGNRSLTGNVKVKVYKGTSLMTENAILELPTAVVSVYMDTNEPRTPVVVVAAGPYIYVYKNLRPYYRFTMPDLEVNKAELDVWNKFKEGLIPVTSLVETLDNLKAIGTKITFRSISLLSTSLANQEKFATSHKDSPLKRQTVITCLETLKKSMPESDAVSCIILGTESKHVHVLDPQAFTVLASVEMPSVPVFLDTSGLFDVEFTIIVACRNGGVYGIKRGSKAGHLLFELRSHPVSIKRASKMILVACMDETLQCYNSKGKQMWSQKMPASVLTMELLDHKTKNIQGVLVALTNNEVRIYIDKNHVDTLAMDDNVVAMKFGKFGREDSTLILITRGGGLLVKMLKRASVFEYKPEFIGPPAAQQQKMNLPKKTKLFLDQTIRERDSGKEIYRQFQHDLYRIRLETARSYVGVLQKSMTPISTSQADPVKLHVVVTGLGPMFKLSMHVQNASSSQPSTDLSLALDYDTRLYSTQQPYIAMPMLVPGIEYVFNAFIQCLTDKGISDLIKVFILKKTLSSPLITAVISMPVSDVTVA